MSGVVKVLAFAGARDVIGKAEIELPLDGESTAQAVMDLICAKYPALEPHRPSIRIAVNSSYVRADEPVRPGDEVALIPPVAGG